MHVNQILSNIDLVFLDELNKLSWETEVLRRSFYVTDAHVWRIIENKTGKDVLKNTSLEGPASFFETYNYFVDDREKIT